MQTQARMCAALVAALVVAAGGCRDTEGGGGGGPDGGENGGDGGLVGEMSIQEVRSDDVADGAEVTLRDVVVIAVDDFGGRRGSVYVMEPEGGPRSGVVIFLHDTRAAGLAPGDLIDVEGGVKAEFAFDNDDSGRSLTQIVDPPSGEVSLSKVGEGALPDPEVVSPGALAVDDEVAERWQSVLVTVEEVAVEGPPDDIPGSDETFRRMTVTGPLQIVSELAPLDEEAEVGDCYASITGIVTYASPVQRDQLMPRSLDDFDRDDQACPPPPDEVTVRAIKGGDELEVGDAVSLGEVVVTGVEGSEHFYVQDRIEEAEPFNGIYVYRGFEPEPLPDELEVGSVVDLVGVVGSFRGATQLVLPGGAIAEIHEADSAEPVVFADPAPLGELVDDDDGGPYEHVLVELGDISLSQDVNQFGDVEVSDGDVTLVVDNELAGDGFFEEFFENNEVSVGDCFATVRGIMDIVDFDRPDDPERRLYVRDEDDLALGGESCPPPGELATVREVKEQDGFEIGDDVAFEGAVVTAIEREELHFFIQDDLDVPEPFNGIYVFRGDDAEPLPGDVEVGSVVDVSGELGSFQGATQIVSPTFDVREGSAEPVILADLPPLADVVDLDDGRPFEHVLVELENLEFVEDAGFGNIEVKGGDVSLIVDNFILGQGFFDDYLDENDVEEGDCFAVIRGLMDRREFGGVPERRIYPRDGGDLELGGGCDVD